MAGHQNRRDSQPPGHMSLRRTTPDRRLGLPVPRRVICKFHARVAESVDWQQIPQGIQVEYVCPGPRHSWQVQRNGVRKLRSVADDWWYFTSRPAAPRKAKARKRPPTAPLPRRPVVVEEVADGSWIVRRAKPGESPFPPVISDADAAGLPHLLLRAGCTMPSCKLKAQLKRIAPLGNGGPTVGRAGYLGCRHEDVMRYTIDAPNLVGQTSDRLVFRR